MQDSALLEIAHLKKSYGGENDALTDVSFRQRPGEFISIIGSSGAGKSTLLKCVNRLVDPTGGAICFNGVDMTTLSGTQLRRMRRRMSMVFQSYNLVYRSSAIENVLQGRLGYKSTLAGALGIWSGDEKRHALRMLERVGLADCAFRRTDQLSGGQQQRVGIARALIQNPLLILADEPIASLDPASSRTVMQLLRDACDKLGIACLVSLHQVDFALEFSDRVIGLAKGVLCYDGPPRDLTKRDIARIYGEKRAEAGIEYEDADHVLSC